MFDYMKNNIVVAVATLGRDPVAADFANLLHEGNILQRENIMNEEWRDKYSIKAKASDVFSTHNKSSQICEKCVSTFDTYEKHIFSYKTWSESLIAHC